jgi:hypothetical protein
MDARLEGTVIELVSILLEPASDGLAEPVTAPGTGCDSQFANLSRPAVAVFLALSRTTDANGLCAQTAARYRVRTVKQLLRASNG